MLTEQAKLPKFIHRHNKIEKTFDSTCTQCQITIGKSTLEAQLNVFERTHSCANMLPFSNENQRKAS